MAGKIGKVTKYRNRDVAGVLDHFSLYRTDTQLDKLERIWCSFRVKEYKVSDDYYIKEIRDKMVSKKVDNTLK